MTRFRRLMIAGSLNGLPINLFQLSGDVIPIVMLLNVATSSGTYFALLFLVIQQKENAFDKLAWFLDYQQIPVGVYLQR